MIENRKGDLLEQADLRALVHQCNCYRTMGAGIALQIRNRWPEAYRADANTMHGDRDKLGTFSKAVVDSGRLWVYNLYSQFEYRGAGVKTDYFAMEKGLMAINSDLNTPRYYEDGVIRIGIPYMMGCGLAAGDWGRVMEVLNSIYEDDDDTCIKYKLIICKKERADDGR